MKFVKQIVDTLAAFIALVIFAPILIVLAILVRTRLGSPIIFSQVRPGYKGKPFKMYKFRSMTDHRDVTGELLPDHERLTSFGKFLRSSSLDELPELLNVLRGEMSIVGPRPLLMEYLPLYTPEQMRRHDMKPGITGWAQVNGRNAISWEDKFLLDVWYIDNWNLRLDIKIIFLTIYKVFKREGITQEGVATSDKFKGSSNP